MNQSTLYLIALYEIWLENNMPIIFWSNKLNFHPIWRPRYGRWFTKEKNPLVFIWCDDSTLKSHLFYLQAQCMSNIFPKIRRKILNKSRSIDAKSMIIREEVTICIKCPVNIKCWAQSSGENNRKCTTRISPSAILKNRAWYLSLTFLNHRTILFLFEYISKNFITCIPIKRSWEKNRVVYITINVINNVRVLHTKYFPVTLTMDRRRIMSFLENKV